ncbi:putative class I-like SAM-binding methyltransferase superfamily, protein arginine N-methyltransferase family protein [Lyophyllum shimeji]|uniref:type I protein arginine methyltransferase n=1 Tax=Lyophyllum shimeji TaxID=47721 RepID=A0A9P3PNK0_LYOSH|nr:putative class I-like SAM-binding methyltransferase superfamily, protein arginine N-methyltransferase family protein [Lyophyllum shimeji]
MSVRLPPPTDFADEDDEGSASESSQSDDDDQNWDDWASDSLIQVPCRSLFEEKTLASAEEALAYDRLTHGFDLNAVCSKLALDFHGRIRLINYIRKEKPSPGDLALLDGSEAFFKSDEYLLPVLEDDPLLQVNPDDWSDSEEEDTDTVDPTRRVQILQRKLAEAKQKFVDYRAFVSKKMNIPALLASPSEPGPSQTVAPARDDDTHYFKSYAENDIHAVMIQDKVRTSTYAYFILTNPALFRDAVVLDVGCGTGILSLFAARSGAKRVIAVDASDIAEKAERIVKANGFEDIITVIRGKVEEITLPDDIKQVDIIVSEWMGYALLYESMLDSVLHARDRFLRPGGVMAPSQCRMELALCDATEVYKERIGFWNDVYGFDLSAMAEDLYDDAIIDVVGPDTLLSAPYTIKDLILSETTPRQLDFSSSFTLVSTAERRTKVNSFVLYFDTFFTVSGHPVPSSTDVKIVKEGDVIIADIWPAGGKPAPQRRRSQGADKDVITSFSTGPQSVPTHWKQTLFLLREPVTVAEGSIVHGTFRCRKSEDNSRELDVEIHFSVKTDPDGPASDTFVRMFKVR